MTERNKDLSNLPMQTLQDIPQPNVNAKQITALVKEDGRITGYQLSDGQVISKEEGVRLAKQQETGASI